MGCSCFRCSEPDIDFYPVPCTIGSRELCSGCLAVDTLEDQIHAAEAFLASLKAKRRPTRDRINQVHDPFASRLPPEVVSHIFMTFLPEEVCDNYGIVEPDNTATTPLRLGAVCQTWRAIAWSTPQLWTSISIDMYNDNLYVTELVRDWLSRSGQLPLYIRLYREEGISDPPFGPRIELLISAIVAHSNRWVYMDMELPQRIVMRVRCTSPMPLALKTLRLDMPEFDFGQEGEGLLPDEKINLNAIISPTEMVLGRLGRLGPSQIDIEWNNLTRLTAQEVSINECFELLQKAPQMTHCTLDINIERGDFPIPQTVVQYPRLSFLDINYYYFGMEINTFLEWTSFPALETWNHKANEKLPIDHIIAHITRSSCRLKSMKLSHNSKTDDPNELIKLLRATPSLERLTLLRTYNVTDTNYFDPLLNLLSTSTINERGVGREIFLPHLMALDITGCQWTTFSWDYIPRIFGFDRESTMPFLPRESTARSAKPGYLAGAGAPPPLTTWCLS
ncbi:hypothetical protein BDZ97DRAFT_2086342 [Flammula alnicola]|nr:hypothetical protein BDZ97DRAFT_2086342 [Flammula alnicola]